MLTTNQRLESILPDLFEASPDASVIIDASGHIVFVNAEAETLFGHQRAELLGQPVEILVPERLRSRHVALRDAYLASPRVAALKCRGELFAQRKDGSQVPVGINLNPITTEAELLVVAAVRDMTARKLVERSLTALQAVMRILAEPAEVMSATPRMMQAICEALGWDVGEVWAVDRHAQVLRCVDVWHAPTLEVPTFAQASRQAAFYMGVGLPGRIWHSQRPAWIPDVTQDTNFPRAAIAASEQLHGAYGLPLSNGVEILGVMEFFSRERLSPDSQLIEVMATIGGAIGQFLEGCRAKQKIHDDQTEFALARQIQQGLLPKTMPVLPGFAFGGASQFCHATGGDYYDFLPMSDSSLGIVIGDVSGHGIAAALVMADIRALLHALVPTHADPTDPSSIVALTNRFLTEDLPSGHFVTLFLARLDPDTRSLVYCSAGHPSGYVLDQHGVVRSVLQSTDIPLGLELPLLATEFPNAPSVTLLPGDFLCLFTDGVMEALSAEDVPFGIERALNVVREHRHERPDEIVQALFRAVADFSGNQAPLDDITTVIIKVGAAA